MPRTNKPNLPDAATISQINQTISQLGRQTVRDKVVAAYSERLAQIESIESYAHQLTPDELARKRFRKLSNDELLMLALTFVAKQDTPKPVRLYPYLDKIKELLQSEQYSELAAGIAAATGRRFSEVIERGTMVLPLSPSSSYELIFEGQLKKSELPTVNYQIKRHFQETGIVEVLEGEAAVTVHNLRGIYGAIAAHFFCPSLAQFPRFLSQNLGHLIGDETVDSNLSRSTEHYFHYYLVSENGYKIEAMGIKLDEPMPSLGFVQLAQEFLMSNDPWCKLTGVIATTGAAPDDLLKHFVYKRVEGDQKILYTHQVHAVDTPYFEIITLLDATQIWDAIAQLKIHPLKLKLLRLMIINESISEPSRVSKENLIT